MDIEFNVPIFSKKFRSRLDRNKEQTNYFKMICQSSNDKANSEGILPKVIVEISTLYYNSELRADEPFYFIESINHFNSQNEFIDVEMQPVRYFDIEEDQIQINWSDRLIVNMETNS